MWSDGKPVKKPSSLEDSTANDEHSFLFRADPLYDSVRTLGERSTRGVRTCHAVQLEDRRCPSKRHAINGDTVVYFEMRILRVYAGVQCMVERHES